MSELVRRYKEYYREQTPNSFDLLFGCMLEYDFSSYHEDMRRVHSMWREAKCLGESGVLFSGGSSLGVFRKYEFGPNFHDIRIAVEGFLRLSHRRTLLLAYPDFGFSSSPRFFFQDSGRPPKSDFEVVANWEDESRIEMLFGLVDDLYVEHGPINICSLPHIWMMLTNSEAYRRLESRFLSKINALVNTDAPRAFGKVACKTRDQMIDWCSGLNFYTCVRGEFHFLPTFLAIGGVPCANLLSLKRNSKSSDDLVFMDGCASSCSCGLPTMRPRFFTHSKNIPLAPGGGFVDFDRLPSLVGPYTENMQVFQSESEEISVFYSSRKSGGEGAKAAIEFLESVGFGKIDIVIDKYFRTGQKIPFFWRGSRPEPLEFITPGRLR